MTLAHDFLQALADRKAGIERELAKLQAEFGSHQSEAAAFDAQIERNRRELGGYLISDIDDETLKAVEKRYHYPSLLAHKAPWVTAIDKAERDLAELESSRDWIEREIRQLEAQQTIADLEPTLSELRVAKDPWDRQPMLVHLERRGFFETSRKHGFFARFANWREGSLLMAALEKLGLPRFRDLDDLRERWGKLKGEFETIATAHADAQQSLEAVRALETRHRGLLAEPSRLFKACWDTLARMIVDHLIALPEAQRVEFAVKDANLNSFLKKDAGLRKQAAYLRELAQVRLGPAIASLEAELSKVTRKHTSTRSKLMRHRSVAVSERDLANMRNIPVEKWEKRRASSARLRERVSGWHTYDHGSFISTYLWWDVMTRGAAADDIYEVRTFRAANPTWDHTAFVDPAGTLGAVSSHPSDLAASAFADQMLSDTPMEGLFDAS
jgi:archaellum component FlaC